MKPSANALLLLIAASVSSSSSLAAAADSPPAGVACAAADPSSLQLNECLTAGNAICSPSEGWAFGIDPADQRIKLWKGDQVRFSFAVGCLTQCSRRARGEHDVEEQATHTSLNKCEASFT